MKSEAVFAAIDELALKLNIKSIEEYDKIQEVFGAYSEKEQATNNFWRERYRELSKEILELAGFPTTSKEHRLNDAFKVLKAKINQ